MLESRLMLRYRRHIPLVLKCAAAFIAGFLLLGYMRLNSELSALHLREKAQRTEIAAMKNHVMSQADEFRRFKGYLDNGSRKGLTRRDVELIVEAIKSRVLRDIEEARPVRPRPVHRRVVRRFGR